MQWRSATRSRRTASRWRRSFSACRPKIRLQSLGADTDLFHPVETQADVEARSTLRQTWDSRTRTSSASTAAGSRGTRTRPLLARAIDALHDRDPRFKGLFIGDGVQKDEIAACRNTRIVSFMKHADLAEHYRAADIAVWPTQESMSMLDAAASGLPIVVSNRIGEKDRVNGNGEMYEQDSMTSLITDALRRLADAEYGGRMAPRADGRCLRGSAGCGLPARLNPISWRHSIAATVCDPRPRAAYGLSLWATTRISFPPSSRSCRNRTGRVSAPKRVKAREPSRRGIRFTFDPAV